MSEGPRDIVMPNFVKIGQSVAEINIAIFRLFKMSAAAILDFRNSQILLADGFWRAKMHHRGNFPRSLRSLDPHSKILGTPLCMIQTKHSVVFFVCLLLGRCCVQGSIWHIGIHARSPRLCHLRDLLDKLGQRRSSRFGTVAMHVMHFYGCRKEGKQK